MKFYPVALDYNRESKSRGVITVSIFTEPLFCEVTKQRIKSGPVHSYSDELYGPGQHPFWQFIALGEYDTIEEAREIAINYLRENGSQSGYRDRTGWLAPGINVGQFEESDKTEISVSFDRQNGDHRAVLDEFIRQEIRTNAAKYTQIAAEKGDDKAVRAICRELDFVEDRANSVEYPGEVEYTEITIHGENISYARTRVEKYWRELNLSTTYDLNNTEFVEGDRVVITQRQYDDGPAEQWYNRASVVRRGGMEEEPRNIRCDRNPETARPELSDTAKKYAEELAQKHCLKIENHGL